MAQRPNPHGTQSPHQSRRVASARALFVEVRGEAAAAGRQAEIAALPSVVWRGRNGDRPAQTLYTIRCHGRTGKGPHDCNVPESLLWSLMSIKEYYCVYHPRDRQ